MKFRGKKNGDRDGGATSRTHVQKKTAARAAKYRERKKNTKGTNTIKKVQTNFWFPETIIFKKKYFTLGKSRPNQ